MNKRNKWTLAGLAAAAVVVAGCAALPSGTDLDKLALDVAKASFQDAGPVKTDRLVQDETNRECSAAQTAGVELSAERAKAIEAINMKTIRWPAGGRFLGDWQEGEKIAQSGRGLTWTDDAKTPNGGNCYNCHQISKQEISFGTIGPSLYQYGKLRGVADPQGASSKAIVEYTWGKIWNAKAYNACSNMPRSGHMGNLSEQQIKHLMALLLDPASPVNQ
jgi:L-cysteine S-thiosulfotransferase